MLAGVCIASAANPTGHVLTRSFTSKASIPAITADRTPLHLAAFRGNLEEVVELLDGGTKAELQDADGNTAFHLACYPGSPEVPAVGVETEQFLRNKVDIVRLLAERLDGVVLDMRNQRGENGFVVAVKSGFRGAVEALLDLSNRAIIGKYLDYNMRDNNGDNAFTFGCRTGQKDLVLDCVIPNRTRIGIDPSGKGARGKNGLSIAALNGHADLVRELLSMPDSAIFHVASPNSGNFPFHYACTADHEETVLAFLDYLGTFDHNALNKARKTPSELCGARNRGWIEKKVRIYESQYRLLKKDNLVTVIPGSFLGDGTFGLAYECQWEGETMVIKIPQPEQLNTRANYKDKVMKEIMTWAVVCRTASGDNHDNGGLLGVCIIQPGTDLTGFSTVLPIVGYCDTSLRILSPIARGGTMWSYLWRIQAQPYYLDHALRLLRGVASGMAHVHGVAKIVHGDLKPANVFVHLEKNGKPVAKIADFGGARLRVGADMSAPTQGTGESEGTWSYLPPESRVTSKKKMKEDVWAFGGFVYTVAGPGTEPYSEWPVDQVSNIFSFAQRHFLKSSFHTRPEPSF